MTDVLPYVIKLVDRKIGYGDNFSIDCLRKSAWTLFNLSGGSPYEYMFKNLEKFASVFEKLLMQKDIEVLYNTLWAIKTLNFFTDGHLQNTTKVSIYASFEPLLIFF